MRVSVELLDSEPLKCRSNLDHLSTFASSFNFLLILLSNFSFVYIFCFTSLGSSTFFSVERSNSKHRFPVLSSSFLLMVHKWRAIRRVRGFPLKVAFEDRWTLELTVVELLGALGTLGVLSHCLFVNFIDAGRSLRIGTPGFDPRNSRSSTNSKVQSPMSQPFAFL